jgi:hypothetical protein
LYLIYFLVVPRRMVLGEIICKVEFTRGPDEVELALLDYVFHSPVAHVERLGKLLAHFGIEDAVGSAVAGFERGSGGWLFMAEFFEGGTYGAGMFPAHVDGAGFSSSCWWNDIHDGLAEDVNGAIRLVAAVVPA